MELKDYASISGKSGLFKIVKPTRNGVIVESIDESRKKIIASASNRISVLEEISLYTNTGEGSIPLKDVFKRIYQEFKDDPGVTGSSSSDELKAFLEYIEPEYDKEKVYVSDIKKIVNWYLILLKYYPEIFEEEEEKEEPKEKENTEAKGNSEEPENETKPSAPPKKADSPSPEKESKKTSSPASEKKKS